MRTQLEQRFLEHIRKTQMIAPGERVAVAVSGGADSVALLCLLANLRDTLGVTLLVVHFDHALRGAESDADEKFVSSLARYYGFEYISDREEVAAAATAQKWNLEDAARRLRYAFFGRIVCAGRATRVAVAHTADDQAETVLAHLLRGSGLEGLSGMSPASGFIVRPLLDFRRSDLRDYLNARGQMWREDYTNLDLTRQRSRIREQLLPTLARDFSTGITHRLTSLADICREEEAFWSALVDERFRALARRKDEKVTIAADSLLSPLGSQFACENTCDAGLRNPLRALTKRLVRRLYEQVRGDCQDLTSDHIDQVIRLTCESASGHWLQLPGGVVVERNFGELGFSRQSPMCRSNTVAETEPHAGAYQYMIPLPQRGMISISVPELGSRFDLKVIDWPAVARETSKDSIIFDADLLKSPLILRNWRPGDAYRPCGRSQPKKLKEMFQSLRVPRSKRASWPVLVSQTNVIWTRGMRPAGSVCTGDTTRAGAILEEVPNETAGI